MKLKILVPAVAVFCLLLFASYLYYNKPHRSVDDESAIAVTAEQLYQQFETNESEANLKYLDKAVEVTGIVSEISSNLDGNSILILNANSSFGGISCTLRDKQVSYKKGDKVVVKGICKGYLSDVVITEARIQ